MCQASVLPAVGTLACNDDDLCNARALGQALGGRRLGSGHLGPLCLFAFLAPLATSVLGIHVIGRRRHAAARAMSTRARLPKPSAFLASQ